jgi:4-amino-4-deoxy-L-arabinose transferase-like glycosyltransferase
VTKSPRDARFLLSAVAIAFVVGGLWFYRLGSIPFRFGEWETLTDVVGTTLEQSSLSGGPFRFGDAKRDQDLAHAVAAGKVKESGNSILYVVLQHAWNGLVGLGEARDRLPSLLFGFVTVALIYSLAHDLFGRRTARWAAVLALIHPLLVVYSRQVRTYSMTTMFAVLSGLLFFRIVRAGEEDEKISPAVVIGYGVASGAMVLGHYLSVYILVGEVIYAFLFVRKKRTWISLASSGAVAGAIVAAWMVGGGLDSMKYMQKRNADYQLRAVNPSAAEDFALPTSPRTLLAGSEQIVLTMAGCTLQNVVRMRFLLLFLPLPLALAGFALRDPRKKPQIFVALLGMGGLVSAVALALHAGHVVSMQPVYAIFSTPFFLILIAAGIARACERHEFIGTVAGIGLVAMGIASTVVDLRVLQRSGTPYRAIAARVCKVAQPGDLLVGRGWPIVKEVAIVAPCTPDLATEVDASLTHEAVLRRADGTQLPLD